MKTKTPLFVAALMTLLSLAGLFFQSTFYPTQDLQRAFVSNDVVNLLIGLPALLLSPSLARRGKLIGVLLLPGALLYVAYNYIAYSIATWTSVQSIFYIALVGLSAWSAFQSFAHIDKHGIQQKLHGRVPSRFAGGVLTVFGLLFFLRGLAQVYAAISNSDSLVTPEMSVVYADLLITPLWILGGLSLWRRQAFGYAAGAGLLFQASMLFIALLVFFILQPFLTGAEFPATDFAVIFGMGLVFFIPFGLFVRGILSAE
ncbi:MAG: hypothetical protein ACOYZ8_11700 [Chloroflexota bacterium]